MATISIALCTYNGEKYLQEQLDSFLGQQTLPDEVVICDDRSNDSTVAILERFAAAAPFSVRVTVNETNIGSDRNFENAILLCTGDLIFLSDQDDVWLPQKIMRMKHEFERDVGLVFSDAEVVDESLQQLGRTLSSLTFDSTTLDDIRNGRAFHSLLNQNFVTGATAAFRASLRPLIDPMPAGIPNLIHDGWIALSLARSTRVSFVDEKLIKYRQHGSQQVGLRLPEAEGRRKHFESTTLYLERDVERLRKLKDIFDDDLDLGKKIDELIADKKDYLDHCRVRMNLPAGRVDRVTPVIVELFSGRYGRFSAGIRSAVKDIIEG
ncbi:MAG TPA: glycosyltransferase family 2 protein [Pyrinomonadaceae bacterium]|nr:glycosyltransferase family 2 protein [Pyrinomonadaceae bacterium]